MRLLLVLCVVSLSLPAQAKPAKRTPGPTVLLSTAPLLQLEDQREELHTRLNRVDKVTANAFRQARDPAVKDLLDAARDRLAEVRQQLGVTAVRGASTQTLRGADPRLISAALTPQIVVVELDTVLQSIGMIDRSLKSAVRREKGNPKIVSLLDEARSELQSTRALLVGVIEPSPGTATPPPAPVMPPRAWPMSDSALQSLLAAMDDEPWARDRLDVFAQGSQSQYFTVAQVLSVLGRFDFANQKLKAVGLMKPRILDAQNLYRLYGAFEFSSDKDELRKILEAPAQVSAPQPAPAPSVQPIDDRSLQVLLQQLRATNDQNRRFQMLQQTATAQYFVIRQVQAVCGLFPTPDSRMRAVVALSERVLDPQNHEELYSLFPARHDQSRIRDLLLK